MSADPTVNQAADPGTPPGHLAWIAENRPDLRPVVAGNASAYPELLTWLARFRDPAIDAALASRARGPVPGSGSGIGGDGDVGQASQQPTAGETWRPPRWAKVVAGVVTALAVLGVAGWVVLTQVIYPRGADSPDEAVTDFAAAVQEGDLVRAWLLLSPDEVAGVEDVVEEAAERAVSLDLLSAEQASSRQVAITGLRTRVTTLTDDRARVDITGGTLTIRPGTGEVGARAQALARRSDAEVDGAGAGAGAGDGDGEPYTVELAEVASELDGALSVAVVREGRRWFISPLLTAGALASQASGHPTRLATADELSRSSATPEEAARDLVTGFAAGNTTGMAGALTVAEGLPVLENSDHFADAFADSRTQVTSVDTSVQTEGRSATVTLDGLAGVDSDGSPFSFSYEDGCATTDGEQDCAADSLRPLLPQRLQLVTRRDDDGRWGVSVVDSLAALAGTALEASDDDILRALDLQTTAQPVATLGAGDDASIDMRTREYATVRVDKGDGPLLFTTGIAQEQGFVDVARMEAGVATPVQWTWSSQGVVLTAAEAGEYRFALLPHEEQDLSDDIRVSAHAVPTAALAVGQGLGAELAPGQAAVYDLAEGWLSGTVTAAGGQFATAVVVAATGEVIGGFSDTTLATEIPAGEAQLVLVSPPDVTTAVDLSLSSQPPLGFQDGSGALQETITVPVGVSAASPTTVDLVVPAGLPVDVFGTPAADVDVVLVVDGSNHDAGFAGDVEHAAQVLSNGGPIQVSVYAYGSSGLFSSPGSVVLTVSPSGVGD